MIPLLLLRIARRRRGTGLWIACEESKDLCDCWNAVCAVIVVGWWTGAEEMVMWRETRFHCQEEELSALVQLDVKFYPLIRIVALIVNSECLYVTNHLIKRGRIFTAVVCAWMDLLDSFGGLVFLTSDL